MKGLVTDSVINTADRTADLTVELYDDTGQLVTTETLLISVDDLAETGSDALVISRLTDLVEQTIIHRSAIPLTEQQVEDKTVGRAVFIPG